MDKTIQQTIFVKVQERSDYASYYALDIPIYNPAEGFNWNWLTAWPLPSFGHPIGSCGSEWPEDLRVVRRKPELRKCQEWYDRMQDSIPRMTFYCQRDGETIIVQNKVGLVSGQLHSHSEMEFETWKAEAIASGSREKDFIWI